ncbi:MAG TPA: Gfo/Idh/MocA family oxidoreductase [Isosphaeraceae bacterium]|nr:Gfo/Idh/MocA family oxidoreductase [Isosphaeraceae bacterium]
MAQGINRRAFSKTAVQAATVATAAASLAPGRVLGANDRVRLGFIGVGNRGCQLLKGFLAHADAQVVALCDVYEPYLHGAYDRMDPRFAGLGKRTAQMPPIEGEVARVKDFRAVLDRKDVDAVVIATPDHWHAIQMIAACKAGKDVYVEKPLSMTIVEGRAMVEAARKSDRIVQVGTHRRSSRLYAQLAEAVHSGALGKVTVARAAYTSNMAPTGIGHAPASDPPAGLDWDLWLGPRPERPFQATIMPYKFRWWHLYSSQMANWGVHYFDLIRWLTGELAPASVSAHGGRFAVDDDRTIPDTSEAVFEHASGMLTVFSIHEANGQPVLNRGAEVELRGTLGTAYATIKGYEIVPERGGAFQDPKPRRKSEVVKATDGDLDQQAARDFLDCVKSHKRPAADVEEGHRSTTFALLANIALATRQRLDWDPQAERFSHCEAANQLLHYEYRKPWSLA